MRQIVDVVPINSDDLVFEVSKGVVREVLDGDHVVADALYELDEANPRRFRLRYVPIERLRCLVAINEIDPRYR